MTADITKLPPLRGLPLPNERPAAPPLAREFHPLPALLSYLVPGLGQVYQGRVAKGLLFFVCIGFLFVYGMALGSWSNVYLPNLDAANLKGNNPWNLSGWPADLYNRPQFAGQFWVGVAAWPAIVQYFAYDHLRETGPLFGTFQRAPYESRSDVQPPEDKADDPATRRDLRKGLDPFVALKDWNGRTLNELQRDGDKTWDLGWVFTVIAGVLNIMVIFDALAGPAFRIVNVPAPRAEALK